MNNLDIGFYKKTLRPDRQHSYKIIVDYIINNIKPDLNSVIDYGCGAGWFLYYFKNRGITDVLGIEPNKNIRGVLDKSVKSNIEFLNLTEVIKINRFFDLSMNIEVMEHIDEKYSTVCLDNITSYSSTLIFSAATPGQGGWGHVNEQPFSYWENRLNDRDFVCNKNKTAEFRRFLKINKANNWYIKNISVFESRSI